MFAWKEKRDSKTRIEKLMADHQEHFGANRRAIGLFPTPRNRAIHDVSQSHSLRYHQLLISIEGNHQTCCLRIVSPAHKSRSAIMVFRGRVLGCMYGRKGMQQQLFGQQALEQAMSDLAHPESILDAYLLPEDLVLAAGGLFHGSAIDCPATMSAEQVFESSCEMLMRSNMPGCVVVNDYRNLAVCMVYVFGGRIVGVYSFNEGWVETSFEAGLRYVTGTYGARVMGSMLPCHNVKEVMDLTISLTGLADRKATIERSKYLQGHSAEDIILNCSPEGEKLRTTLQLNQINSRQTQSGLRNSIPQGTQGAHTTYSTHLVSHGPATVSR
ncbi:MAG TPA: hypothetical protein V6D17_20495 [Candidatus Obscuribacterales bacterium]